MMYAEIVVDVPLSSQDQHFDYIIPNLLIKQAVVGSRVLVPFGKRNVEGYILHIKNTTDITRLREIIEVLDPFPPLNPELIEVGRFMSDRYFAPLFSSLQLMVPASLRSKYVKCLEWNEERDDLPLIVLPEEEEVLSFVRSKRIIESKLLFKRFPQAEQMIERFIVKGFIKEITKIKDDGSEKLEKIVCLNRPLTKVIEIIQSLATNASKQKLILELLMNTPRIPQAELLIQTKATTNTINRLRDLEIIRIEETPKRRDPFANRIYERDYARPLTNEQKEVFDQIVTPISEERHQSFLLHGVTGSGKTEVYLQIIEYVIGQNKEAIVLVPEISLTPMMVGRFKSRFGDQIAVLHSGLSAGEKLDEWRRIRAGEAKVVIGARSAIFAPVPRLGIVIIDEEHETTYKQEELPRYHAREIAIMRASITNSVVLLGSATPSLESYAYARTGRYQLLEMQNRVNEQSLPKIHLVDMRSELQEGHRHMFSRLLINMIEDRLQRQEQTVLLLNRRGYSTFVICRSCGYTAECPHCDITLTFHQTNQTIRCHYCGYSESMPKECPKCSSSHIRFFGTGTQKVEEELVKLFPGVRVIRMDMDTTSRKGAHEKLLTAFGNHEADILLGTQMIAKGLDFPKVSLVGMISADTMLHLPDFRSSERTFQLITQVAGRAGRHDIPGEVVVQTYTPENYCIQMSVEHNYHDFFNQEIKLRKLGNYPPFYRLCMIHFTHEQIPILVKSLGRFVDDLHTRLSNDSSVYGPVPSSITRIKDRYRYHCMIKYKNEPKLNQILRNAIKNIEDMIQRHQIQISIDIDPQFLL